MGYISKEFIDKLLSEVDIVNLFQHYGIEVKKKGTYFWCLSPFKEEKSPSCQLKQTIQRFVDYSTGKNGNVITFVMDYKTLNYPEAVEELAKFQGLNVEYENETETKIFQEKRSHQAELRKLISALKILFQSELQKLPKTHPAWLEIEKRKYTIEDVKEWEIGFAPGNKFIYEYFSSFGNVDAAKKLGLVNDKNNDSIWNRLVYPIYDDRDQIVGFASRDITGSEDSVKWMNPKDNDLYKKDQILFGLNSAKNAILKNNRVWLVEGYNDVIAWQKNGLENTVAPCGTSLMVSHIKIIKRLTQKVTICFDPDSAGKKAVMKYLPLLLENGFSVDVCQMPKVDPDDYSREYEADIKLKGLPVSLQPFVIPGFQVLLLEKLQGDEIDMSNGIKEIAKTISKIPDFTLQTLYIDRLTKESKQKPAHIRSLIKSFESDQIKVLNQANDKYEIPRGVTTPIDVLAPIIDRYQMFISDNQIWMQINEYEPYQFKSISNFSIEILQHMHDEKFAAKLIKVCNVSNDERIFDAPADALTAPLDFKKLCARQGNYKFKGDVKDLDKLTDYLYDKMGVGGKIDVMGWDVEGFHVWNNTVTVPGKENIAIDKNGMFNYEGHTYYVPSANEIYRKNNYKYKKQKRCVLKATPYPLEEYLDQMKKVHGKFGVLGMLFAFAAAHQDLIIETAKGFPEYFLYGPPSTGKDELYGIIKGFFGIDKKNFINLENRQSTGKARLRLFAEYSNCVVHLSEYANGDKETDGMLKGLWDRGSYSKATLDSNVSTESLPILSAALVAGNQAPTDEALLTRLIYGEMVKNKFTLEERKQFEKLEEMTTEGITSYMNKAIFHRPIFEKNFTEKFYMFKRMLSGREAFKGAEDRIITNYAILGATHEILKETNDFVFPFTSMELLDIFDEFVKILRAKLESASLFTKFWDVFIWCLRGSEVNRLNFGTDFKVEGDLLYLRFTAINNRIQTEWYPRFTESCPNKATLQNLIKQQKYFVEEKSGTRFGKDENGKDINTSAYVLDLQKFPKETREDLLFSFNVNKEELEKKLNGMASLFPNSSPLQPPKTINI